MLSILTESKTAFVFSSASISILALNIDEWGCLDARITITTNSDGNIVALQKGGRDGFSLDQLVKCSELSITIGKKIREIVKQATEGGK